jgi:hypothetical protein
VAAASQTIHRAGGIGGRALTRKGHAGAGFTLKVYARDGRDETAVVDDVLAGTARIVRAQKRHVRAPSLTSGEPSTPVVTGTTEQR